MSTATGLWTVTWMSNGWRGRWESWECWSKWTTARRSSQDVYTVRVFNFSQMKGITEMNLYEKWYQKNVGTQHVGMKVSDSGRCCFCAGELDGHDNMGCNPYP